MQRPDLTNIDPEVLAYIEYLEKKTGVRQARAASANDDAMELPAERAVEALPAEHETTINIITVTQAGLAKRTYRHLYTRQHRGGMGVYGIDVEAPDIPLLLSDVDDSQNLILFTNRARAFRMPLSGIPSAAVFSNGTPSFDRLMFDNEEWLVAVLPEQARGSVALVTEKGRVRVLRHHLFGEHMRPGMTLFKDAALDPLAAAGWTTGDAELFLVTRAGMGIRFAEKSLPGQTQGDLGIRLSPGDAVVALASVYPDSSVFILGADGRGTVRQMSGFAPNKTPGGSGKIAFKSAKVVGAATVEVNDDIFILSRLGKIIRFPSDEVPLTEGVVQGVNCMSFRADEAVALLKSGPIY